MNNLGAQALHYSLDGRSLLRDIHCTLEPGELVGLIGPNAAGKSTLLRLLAGLLPPGAGDVSWQGAPLQGVDPVHRARGIGYLAQRGEIHWGLSVAATVELGRLPFRGWNRASSSADREAVDTALAAADVAHLRERGVNELSGGERMRVLLARVLAGTPQVILADEPTAALDPWHQLQVMELLLAEARQGRIVLAVLHDLALAARFCDRLLLLDKGELIASGAPRQVLTPQRLASVYGVEAEAVSVAGREVAIPWRRLQAHGPA